MTHSEHAWQIGKGLSTRLISMLAILGGFNALPASTQAQDVQHLIQISVDGLHAGQLRTLLRTQPDRFANFQRFVAEGATTLNARTDFFSTYTLPNHTTMITARPVLQPADDATIHHGYTRNGNPPASETLHNGGNPSLSYIASTFDVAHDYGLSTALYSGKSKFAIFPQSYNVTSQTAGGRPDQYLENGDQGHNKIDRVVLAPGDGSSADMMNIFLADMQSEAYGYAFLHFLEPDAIGHSAGWSTTAWDESVALVDQQLGRLFELVETHEEFAGNTSLLLTADHGGLGLWHNDDQNANMYTVPFLVWGPGIAAGADLYELNRATRLDPVRGHPEYTMERQPIRNGDSANLAMGLLGLPAVEGSSINARQDLLVAFPAIATWTGANAMAGAAGDGTNWDDARNWSRDGRDDIGFTTGDVVRFPVQTTEQTILTSTTLIAESVQVDGGQYSLPNGVLQVVSGRVQLDPDAQLGLVELRSDRGIILEGGGTLAVHGSISNLLQVEGVLTGDARVLGYADLLDRVEPGDGIGSLQVEQNLTLGSQSRLRIELGRKEEAAVSDLVTVGGRASLRGRLQLVPLPEYEDPVEEGAFDFFPIMTMPRWVGAFYGIDYAGEPVTFEYATMTERRTHAGAGLFRSAQLLTGSISWRNYRAIPGDADGDGRFDTTDLVTVFVAGRYEDGENDNANWPQGDWNGDLDFDSADMIAAFTTGWYERGSVFDHSPAAQAVPEPSTAFGWLSGILLLAALRRVL